MDLIEQLIKKKMELYEENWLNRNYFRAIWNFYSAFQLSAAYLDVDVGGSKFKSKLWVRLLQNPKPADSVKFKKLQKLINEDMKVIQMALGQIEDFRDLHGEEKGDLYRRGTVGVFVFQHP